MALSTRKVNGCLYAASDGYQAAVIPMKATGKARPRVTVKGTFMPKAYQDARDALRWMFGTVTVRMPCALRVTISRKMPASWSKKRRDATLGMFCETKPDNDNVEGWIMDALFPESDSAVVWNECIKVWGPRDLLKIEIWEVNTDEPAISMADFERFTQA